MRNDRLNSRALRRRGRASAPAQGGTAGAEPVTVTYCNFMPPAGNEETLAKMVAAFEAENPGIKIDVETIGYDDYFTRCRPA
jgi:multiple sugar transport system substrate-binding protein